MDLNYATLEITTHIGCPVDCSYCPQDKTVKNYTGERIMTVDTLRKCLDKIPIVVNKYGDQSPRIEFSGFCEPFTNPNCSDLINLVYDKGFRNITLYTTLRGMKLSDYEKIKHIPFSFVSVHLPDTDGLTKIKIHNEYYELLGKIMDTFTVGFFAYGNMNTDVINFIGRKEPEAFTGKFMWVNDIHSRAGNIDTVQTRKKLSGHIKCGAIYNMEMNHNILLPNADVVLCCMDFGLKHIVGNLLKDEYYDLYKSDEHNKVVAGMYVEKMNSMCRLCDSAVPNDKN